MKVEVINKMKNYKLIHCNIFRPHNALFKKMRNDRAEVQIISCNNGDNCGLFKKGECLIRVGQCPYGEFNRYVGFSQRASRYYSWINEQEKKYKGIPFLKQPTRLAIVGDYMTLPYLYMDMHKEFPFADKITSSIKKEDFTIENIIKLIKFIPRTLWTGGVIQPYQKEVIPKFLKHLSEEMPNLFDQVVIADEYAKNKFAEFTNIGRKAILETITPNVGQFKDIHGGLWQWDGERLTSTNSRASFLLINKFKELTIIPDEKQIVAITDENQVNGNTVFVE